MTEETNSEITEALEAVGEKSGGEVEASEDPTASGEGEADQPNTGGELAPDQLEALGIEEKPAVAESERHRLRAMIEAAVYVSEEPLTVQQISQAMSQPRELVEGLLAELMEAYAAPHHGITVREVAGGFKMSTKPEFHEDIRTFVKKLKPPLKLSLAALETLAVVAYKQPVTGPEILEIRGVQGGGVLKTLLERKLITAAGRKQVVGKPVLYKTTKEFLVQFGLKDLAELPTLKEFEEWSRLALGEDADEAPAEAEERTNPTPAIEFPDSGAETPSPAPEEAAEADAEPEEQRVASEKTEAADPVAE